MLILRFICFNSIRVVAYLACFTLAVRGFPERLNPF